MKKICLDLGCGPHKKPGFIGVDIVRHKGNVDLVCDVKKGIPVKDNCVDQIYAANFFEHFVDIVALFKEAYRISKHNAKIELVVPYYASMNAFKDPTHRSFFTEETFSYFSKDNWLNSAYKIDTDFKVIKIQYHYSNLIKWLPFKKYLRRYLFNVVFQMQVELKVVK